MDYSYSNTAVNEDYLKQMERNAQLFEQKMKKLNRYQYSEPEQPEVISQGKNDNENNETIRKQIEQLQNEIAYKDSLIAELQSGKPDNNGPNPEYEREIEQMQNELDSKCAENSRLKEENENLKLKIENLKLENANIKSNKEKQINQSENLSIALSEAKEEIVILRKKVNELDLQNKKLNKDYDQLNKNFAISRKENSNLKAEIDEHKATIYNLNHDLNENKKQSQKVLNQQQPQQQVQNNIRSNYGYSNYSSNASNSSYNPSTNININSHYDGFNYFPSEHKIKENMNEMNSLDMELNALLKEKNMLENELFKFPERPRTLNEIKMKKEKNERIKNIEDRVNQIKMRIRILNN